MNTLFKKILKFAIATIICVLLALAFTATKVQADSNGGLWKLMAGKLMPVVSTFELKVPSLGGSGTTCLQSDNTGLITGSGSGCGASFSGVDGNVAFLDPTGTQLIFNDRFFDYKRPLTYLYLKTDNGGDSTGALVMEANSGNYIFKNLLRTGISTNYLLANTPMSDGYYAPIGSWASDNNYFWIKYNTGDADWGKAVYQDIDGYIRNPKYPIDGTATVAIDTRDQDLALGDTTSSFSGVGLYLYGAAEQFVIGSFLTGNYYNYDNATESHNFAYGGTFKQIFNAFTTEFKTDLKLSTAGNGIYIKEGTNATMGTCTLVAGTCTVLTTKVTASSRIFLSVQSLGTVILPKAVGVTARTAGTSFDIKSGDPTDTSVVAWEIVEPL